MLGRGTTVVGILIGLSAAATLLTRQLAGAVSDRHGPKLGVLLGLGVTALSGVAYLVSLSLPGSWGLTSLAIGRLLLGLGDSLFTTGIMAWAVTRVGPQHPGKAMAWIGIAMYGALAVGAPLGAVLGELGGFATVCVATGLLPLLAMPVTAILLGLPGAERRRVPFLGVVRAI